MEHFSAHACDLFSLALLQMKQNFWVGMRGLSCRDSYWRRTEQQWREWDKCCRRTSSLSSASTIAAFLLTFSRCIARSLSLSFSHRPGQIAFDFAKT